MLLQLSFVVEVSYFYKVKHRLLLRWEYFSIIVKITDFLYYQEEFLNFAFRWFKGGNTIYEKEASYGNT